MLMKFVVGCWNLCILMYCGDCVLIKPTPIWVRRFKLLLYDEICDVWPINLLLYGELLIYLLEFVVGCCCADGVFLWCLFLCEIATP